MTGIKKNSEQLRKAVEAGINPSTVTLEDGVNVIKGIIVDHKLVFFIFFLVTAHQTFHMRFSFRFYY